MDQKNSGERSLIKKSASISFLVIIGKVLGFIKQAVIAWAFGANAITDVYFAADSYASLFGNVFAQTIGPTVLTQYITLNEKGENKRAKKLIQNSYLFFALLSLLIIAVNLIFTGQIAKMVGISYTDDQLKELRFFLMMLYPVILFASLSGVSAGYLDSNNRFLPGRLLSLFFSASIIGFVFFFKNTLGIRALLYGFLTGYLLHMILMVSLVLPKVGFGISNPFRNADFVSMIKRFLPLVIGISVVDIGHLVDKIVASSLDAGIVSSLYYGQVISSDIVSAVIITSVSAVLLPTIARSVAAKVELTVLRNRIQRIMKVMTFVLAGIAALYFVEGIDLIRLFFQRGNFDSSNTQTVSGIVICYAISFIFTANRSVLVQTHYAFHDTKSPMMNSIIGVCCNIVLSILLAKVMGGMGIALATSISMIIVFFLSTLTLKKHIATYIIDKASAIDFIKSIMSGAVAVSIGKFFFGLMAETHFFIRMVIVGLSMCVIYYICSILLKEEAASESLSFLKKKMHS